MKEKGREFLLFKRAARKRGQIYLDERSARALLENKSVPFIAYCGAPLNSMLGGKKLIQSWTGAMSEATTIFVALLNEGTEVWRPVPAINIRGAVYQITGAVPEDEEWQFLPEQFVECVPYTFSSGEVGLAAVRAA